MIVITNLVTRERSTYVGLDEIAVAIDRLSRARMVTGHYIRGYDLKVIREFTGVIIPEDNIVDTLDLSRRLCELEKHGLAHWGDLVGLPKLKQPRFDVFTPEMVPYCERDVDLNQVVFDVLFDILVERDLVRDYPVLEEYLVSRTEQQILMEDDGGV